MRKTGMSLLLLAAITAPASAEPAAANGSASATVIRPLRTVSIEDLSFGALTVRGANGGEVVVSPGGTPVSYSGSVAPACGAAIDCRPHLARFAVSGEPDRLYRVQLPGEVISRGTRTGQLLTVSQLTARSMSLPAAEAQGLLGSDGNDKFAIGGTLAVPPATRPDTFRAEISVSVFYD